MNRLREKSGGFKIVVPKKSGKIRPKYASKNINTANFSPKELSHSAFSWPRNFLTSSALSKVALAITSSFALSHSLYAQEADLSPPVLTNAELSVSNVTLSSVDQTLEVSLTATDESVISPLTFSLRNQLTGQELIAIQTQDWTADGGLQEAVFEVTVPNNADTGLWFISGIELQDELGNTTTDYDTLEELIVNRFIPVLSISASGDNAPFDARLSANPQISEVGTSQTSSISVTVQDAQEYDLWFVPNADTAFTDISFSGAISLAQGCSIFDEFAKCTITSSNNNQAITANVQTQAPDIITFGYSVLAVPTNLGREFNWLDNYLELPIDDFDSDGIPNEQDTDDDNDGVVDTQDVFPFDPSETRDSDNDGEGDNGDEDDDNDGVPDVLDAFQFDPTENTDSDGDGIGNNADIDDDNDGVADVNDAFPLDDSETNDNDGDGVGDNADNDDDNDGGLDEFDQFPLDPNETIDSDGDGIGNNGDTDDDGDGVSDLEDAFPRDPSEQFDTDEDGKGDNEDDDDDNDGVRDVDDEFPLDPGEFRDNDQDGIGDEADNDDDNDGVLDFEDAFQFNPNEFLDTDGDRIGNNADPDDDNDGLDDEFDRFPLDPNEVADYDQDGIGNNLDDDDDNDGVRDFADAFPFSVLEWADTDGDGIGNNADPDNDNDGVIDEYDAFEDDPTETLDFDGDGVGNNADTDDDNDGVEDERDAFPFDPTETLDTDNDGIGNNIDTDDDGDRVADVDDLFPLDSSETSDFDGDGIGNNADPDDDADGVPDSEDAFPFDAEESTDNDADGLGDNADLDDDNDGFEDVNDAFPFDDSEWSDNDADGLGDNRDNDDDNDGVLDGQDAFPFDATETGDNDNDGIGNNADDDDDNDGVLDDADAFPFSAAETTDTDGDGIGNNADSDDDNDGIVDGDDSQPLNPTIGDDQAPTIAELKDLRFEATGPSTEIELEVPRVSDNNLNPPTIENDYNEPLAVGDHIITWTAVDFAGNETQSEQKVSIVDTTAPEFQVIDTVVINSSGVLTDIQTSVAFSASDLVDGEVSSELITERYLSSGKQSAVISVEDAAGNTAVKELNLEILPSVASKADGAVAPGGRIKIPVYLSGQAANYPVVVQYSVSGPAVSPTSSNLTIEQGQFALLELEAALTAIIGDEINVQFVQANNAILSNSDPIKIRIDNRNFAPLQSMSLMQNDRAVSLIYQDQGDVEISLNIDDINLSDEHTVLVQINGQTINETDVNDRLLSVQFDPLDYTQGVNTINVVVTESNTQQALSTSVNYQFRIEDSERALSSDLDSDFDGISDFDEGQRDSDQDGIADYLDNSANITTVPSGISRQVLRTEAGYRLSLGDVALLAKGVQATSANISTADLAEFGGENGSVTELSTDSQFEHVSTMLTANIKGLNEVGESVSLIVPLADGEVIGANYAYRKFNSEDGWFTFVENSENALASASLDQNGNCPDPDSSLYVQGLNEGDVCIKLWIQDGGPNDSDKLANGVIKDPGVLGIPRPNRSATIRVDKQTTVIEGDTVRVDASATSDPDGDELTFKWTQIGGLAIELEESSSPLLSFLAPQVNRSETLLFTLEVFDGRATSSENVTVTIRNQNTAPTVSFDSENYSVNEGQSFSVQATITDPDPDVLTITWEQISGSTVSITTSSNARMSFTAPQVSSPQTLVFRVIVSDGTKSVSADISVVVNDVPAPVVEQPDSDGGGTIQFWTLLCLFSFSLLRKIKLECD